ncbi:hypothetical protein [Mucilaginibacter segetis]|uniref:Uncharacterized protein n=1 Tax=Mucilaginibacter segetis TaxID=2793071 RepID=A0A934PU70_9SPHI|nr:hypothetical protein [Mucilaginibacter segetis]MBK0379160.1 hypothetical protein [Mucilaginibacter segetis]
MKNQENHNEKEEKVSMPIRTMVKIPISTAIKRTENWRSFMGAHFSDNKKVPKAVFISKIDLLDLVEEIQANDLLMGVRAYFTLDEKHVKGNENRLTFLIVPVKAGEERLPFDYVDVVKTDSDISNQFDTGQNDTANSNVFDFTKPCPDCCDPTSPLYS